MIIDELAVKLQTNEPAVYSGKRDPDSGEIMFLADILLTRPPKGYNAGTKLLMRLLDMADERLPATRFLNNQIFLIVAFPRENKVSVAT